MSTTGSSVLLTVRGKYIPGSLDGARTLHNDTAGSAEGIAAARSFGDLSHKVYAPVVGEQSGAKEGELLFLDVWDNPKGIMDFFSNAHVQGQAAKMFSARDVALWMPARGSFSYALHAPAGKNDRFVGMIRAPIASPEAAVEIFRGVDEKAQRTARRRGILSHEIFIKMNAPGDASPLELLGVDVWYDAKGMGEHYSDPAEMIGLRNAFTGAPAVSVWTQAPGHWSEW